MESTLHHIFEAQAEVEQRFSEKFSDADFSKDLVAIYTELGEMVDTENTQAELITEAVDFLHMLTAVSLHLGITADKLMVDNEIFDYVQNDVITLNLSSERYLINLLSTLARFANSKEHFFKYWKKNRFEGKSDDIFLISKLFMDFFKYTKRIGISYDTLVTAYFAKNSIIHSRLDMVY